jgi:hypothetical protein
VRPWILSFIFWRRQPPTLKNNDSRADGLRFDADQLIRSRLSSAICRNKMGNARRLAPDAEFLSLYQKISPPLTVQAVSIEILALVLTGNLCVAVTLKEAMLVP